MGEILVKGICLDGLVLGWVKRDYDGENVATSDESADTYERVDSFLKSHGEPVVPEMIHHLPYIGEGFVSASKAASCYIFRNTLVANGFMPYFDRNRHMMQVAGTTDNERAIDDTLLLLKDVAGWEHRKRWRDMKEKRVKVTDKLENASSIVSYLPRY